MAGKKIGYYLANNPEDSIFQNMGRKRIRKKKKVPGTKKCETLLQSNLIASHEGGKLCEPTWIKP